MKPLFTAFYACVVYQYNSTNGKSNDYGIKIYFAKKGESLWDIAKRYEITTKSLIETNNLSDEETLSENTKIILCR